MSSDLPQRSRTPALHNPSFLIATLLAVLVLALVSPAANGQSAPSSDAEDAVRSPPNPQGDGEAQEVTGESDSSGAQSAKVALAAPALDDDLLLFEDLPIVISAARRAQPINFSAVPVSILTSADIHYSGLTTIPEVLQFVPGVDVLQLDRNRFAVGVRGLHDAFSDRTLTLLNGRDASSTIFGGAEFNRFPIFLEDIDRIEIVRGPGGAAFGANAFNGVVNIITKKPKDVQGVFATTTINNFGDTYSQARWGASAGAWSWRLSFGNESRDSSKDAINGSSFFSRDFSRNYRVDSEAVNQLSDQTKLTLGLGYSRIKEGDFEFVGFFPKRDGVLNTTRAFARLDHEFNGGATGYLQWFGNFSYQSQPSLQTTASSENDIEGQLNFSLGEAHKIAVGGNSRFVHITNDVRTPQDLLFKQEPLNEQWGGLFASDTYTINDHATVEAQLRGDYYSETGVDWSGRLALLLSLDGRKRHVLRFSAAKAFRAPPAAFRELQFQRVPLPPPFPPGAFAQNLIRTGNLDNEETVSLEFGYTGVLADGLTLRADGYYQLYRDLIGVQPLPSAPPVSRFKFANLDGANGYGAEVEMALTGERGKVSAWWAYNDFHSDTPAQDVRAFLPARHKVGLTARLFLPGDAAINVNYRFTGLTRGNPRNGVDVGSSNRLDLTLSKKFAGARAEALVGVSDLFDDTQQTIFGLGDLTSHDTPGRAFFARIQFRF